MTVTRLRIKTRRSTGAAKGLASGRSELPCPPVKQELAAAGRMSPTARQPCSCPVRRQVAGYLHYVREEDETEREIKKRGYRQAVSKPAPAD